VKDADLAEIGGGSLRIGVGVGVPFTISFYVLRYPYSPSFLHAVIHTPGRIQD
jgi:hypothetical protein